ncbi:MAG: hypothetical protein Q8836_02470 [Sweet potato little leaf phytoplasma]|nr:hypothetical protein [Sweet potato little leaf phytoplasma]
MTWRKREKENDSILILKQTNAKPQKSQSETCYNKFPSLYLLLGLVLCSDRHVKEREEGEKREADRMARRDRKRDEEDKGSGMGV